MGEHPDSDGSLGHPQHRKAGTPSKQWARDYEENDMEFSMGSVVLDGWKIIRLLGEGSYGRVFEMERTEFGQTYQAALKVITVPQSRSEVRSILSEGMSTPQAEAYFHGIVEELVHEFSIMFKLKGAANIVSCEDLRVIEQPDGIGWDILIRMELLHPLLPYVYEHPMARRDIIKLGIDICKALELCQRYNIIHRDIKPENIFISDNGDYKLGDFGIARTIERTTSGLSKKGTYSYMAPEVYAGKEYGFSVDTYSLGLVLYRMLNKNRGPFLPQPPEAITFSSREQALVRRISGERLPRPFYGEGRLGEIVLKACAFDPKDRYSSPQQMRQELEAILYTQTDAGIIYPSGDELSMDKEPYASAHTAARVRSSTAPEPGSAPCGVPESDFCTESDTQGIFTSEFCPEPDTTEANRTQSVFDSEEAAYTATKKKQKKHRGLRIAVGIAGGLAALLLLAMLITKVALPAVEYSKAEKLLASGDYDGAITAFEALGDYKDSADLRNESVYDKATALLASGDYDGAITAFEALGDYKDSADLRNESVYEKATALLASGDYDGAIAAFEALGDYKDSADMCSSAAHAKAYAEAEKLLAQGQTAEAAVAFAKIAEYEDARERSFALWDTIAARETLAVGSSHTIGLKADGTVVAVGYNEYGQCDVSGWTDIVAVAAGYAHTIGLRADGTVVAVGDNEGGQCDVSGWTDIVAVAAGERYSVGLKADGTVVAVGWNQNGQCDVSGWRDIVAVAAGRFHTVGLKADGTVVAAGWNDYGQCDVSGWRDIVAVAVESWHIVGLRADGTVVAVGDNGCDQCDVSGWRDIVAVAAGYSHTVGLKADGTVVAVGDNEYGQCDVSGWRDIVAVAAGGFHTVGLKADGTVVAVGDNGCDQCDVSGWRNIRIPTAR